MNKKRSREDDSGDPKPKKHVRWASESSLERIREIPGLDAEFRDEYRNCNTCVRGFTNFKGELINPGMSVEVLLEQCVECLNDIVIEADTNYSGKSSSEHARKMTHKKCLQPMAGTIARHKELEVLVTNFVPETNPSVSHQLRNDFMSILISAFRFHRKEVTYERPSGIPPRKQLHLVRLKPSQNILPGSFGIGVRQVGAPGVPIVFTSP